MQIFPCFMQSGSRFGRKRFEVWFLGRFDAGKGGLLRLPEVLHDGIYFRLQEGVATRIVVHGLEFFPQQGATGYPSVQGLDGAVGGAAWLVEQSQFGLAIGA